MLTRLFIILLLILPSFCHGQALTLKKDNVEKTFSNDTFYDFIFVDNTEDCRFTTVSGTIHRVLNDSLQIRAYDINMDDKELDFILNMNGDVSEKDLVITVPKYAVTTLRPYKNKKAHDKQSTLIGIGAGLLFTGLVTIANSYDLEEKSFRKGVLISSGVQVGLGSLLLTLGTKKKYHIEDGWRF